MISLNKIINNKIDVPVKLNLQFFSFENFASKIKNSEIPLNIRTQKQREHIDSTTERKRRIENDAQNNKTPSSYFDSDFDVQNLFDKYKGTGDIFVNQQGWADEYVSVDDYIGYVYNVGKGQYQKVRRFVIKYSSKGVHLHPVKDWGN